MRGTGAADLHVEPGQDDARRAELIGQVYSLITTVVTGMNVSGFSGQSGPRSSGDPVQAISISGLFVDGPSLAGEPFGAFVPVPPLPVTGVQEISPACDLIVVVDCNGSAFTAYVIEISSIQTRAAANN